MHYLQSVSNDKNIDVEGTHLLAAVCIRLDRGVAAVQEDIPVLPSHQDLPHFRILQGLCELVRPLHDADPSQPCFRKFVSIQSLALYAITYVHPLSNWMTK